MSPADSPADEPLAISRPQPHVLRLDLNRPALRNAFNPALIRALHQAFLHAADETASDSDLRVVVLGGHGKAFCAGGDLNWMRAAADQSHAENQADAQALADMLYTLDTCPVPVIGRIHGDCYAGGMGLAAICDVVVASDKAMFCLSEARLGLLPATISPYVLRAMGARAARRYFTTAEPFTAQEAHRLGLVHELCSADELDARVQALVEAICANGPAAVRASKQLVKDIDGAPLTAELRSNTARRIADIRASEEGKAGVSAFLNKQTAPWR